MAEARLTYGVVGKEGAQVMLPLSDEQVTFTTSAQSAVFNGDANIVRFIADADAYVRFGSNPTAVATDMKIPANTVEYFAIRANQRMAIYDGSS